jgi:hypothetical protein
MTQKKATPESTGVEKPKLRKLTNTLRGKIYARISMTGVVSKLWDETGPICTEDEFKKWRADLRIDIEHAKYQFKQAQRSKFQRLTAKRLEDVLLHGSTRTQTFERTITSYIIDPVTNLPKLSGFSTIKGTTKLHDPFPSNLIDGLTKALAGTKTPIEDSIVTLASEGVLTQEQLQSIAIATTDYQQKLIGSINGENSSDRVNSRETIEVDFTDE